jgi:hypothetical protein
LPGGCDLVAGLRPYIEQAFTREHVSIDFAGFSGETLHGVVQEPLDKIRTDEIRPESVSIRMLLPNPTRPMAVPCRVEDLADDPDYRARMQCLRGKVVRPVGAPPSPVGLGRPGWVGRR